MFIIVDLPDPEVPTIAMNSPRSIRKLTSTRARTVSPVGREYVLLMLRNSIMHSLLQDRLTFAFIVFSLRQP